LVLLALAAAGCSRSAMPAGAVESMDVQVSVLPDGGLDVRETLRVVPGAGRMEVHRTVGSSYADAVTFRAASVDAEPVEPGTAGFAVERDDDRRLVASWRREPAPDSMTLGLHYAVTAAVGVGQP